MKQFSKIKKSILDALKESELTIEQLTQKLNMPKNEVVFYIMSLVKYGFVQTGAVDDMDEYFSYKLKRIMAAINPEFGKELKKFGAFDFNACYNCGNCTAVCSLINRRRFIPERNGTIQCIRIER